MKQTHVIIQLFITLTLSIVATTAHASAPLPVPDGAFEAGAVDEREGGDARVEARLYLDRDAIAPGQAITAGVLLTVDPHWHVYWRNSGEAGLATEIRWEIEETQGSDTWWSPMTWPEPEVFIQPAGPITTYGYAGEVMHTATMTLPASWQGGETITIRAKIRAVTWATRAVLRQMGEVTTSTLPRSKFANRI